uniref:MaoC-like domain-containing protein n=1 Tax=Kalanchoe fedtschenkoi TaxID=63787 RepID=A0A7N0V5A3_KALFE
MILHRSMLGKSFVGSLRSFSWSSEPSLLKVGDILKLKRVFSHQDVLDYAQVSHDSNPLHFDGELAREAGFEDALVHGMLVAALFPRIISSNFPGAVYASQSLNFKLPIYVGEEVMGEVQAINIRQSKQKHIAKFTTKCFKEGALVIDGEALAVLPTLAFRPAESAE